MSFWQHRIPTILGFLILLGGMAGGVSLVQKGGVGLLKAEPEAIPQQIKISNITENSFTVSWVTEEEVLGFVKYGRTPPLEETVVDERNKLSGKSNPFLVHHVKVENLSPGTKYYFKIGSGKRLFDNQGKAYEVTTAPALGTPPPADTVYGTILKQDGAPAEGAVVYLTLANSVTLSALTKSDGNWAVPLSVARTSDLSAYITYDPDASVEEIFVQGGKLGTAAAIVATKNDSPVPTITLGKSYDFRQMNQELESEPGVSPSSKFSLQSLGSPTIPEKELAIINPQEGERVTTQTPEILGTGPKGVTIKITLESIETFTSQVKINEDGTWSWTPPSGLPPGEHTVTIVLEDGTTVSRQFAILAAGEGGPAFTATPSAQASPSPTPTTTPIASPTAVPRTAMPATEEGVPEPGYLTPTIFFVILGTVFVFSGLFLNYQNFYGRRSS